MRLGAIDIGTNTVRLMIADWVEEKPLKSLRREAIITRLGEDVNRDRQLKLAAVERTLEALSKYKKIMEDEEVEEITVAATSAARDAHNSRIFLDQAERILGIKVQVLSGEQEAELAFLGATHDLGVIKDESPIGSLSLAPSSLFLVLDIGGGSTELIAGRPPQILYHRSLNIGSVRLNEMFLAGDPPTADEVKKTRGYIDQILYPPASEIKNSSWWQEETSPVLIGVAGTITTMAAVKQELAVYDARRIHHSRLGDEDIGRILAKFLSKPLTERKRIVGVEPKRADVIIAGTLIAISVMTSLGFHEIIVSESDILDGLILSFSHFNTIF